MSSANKRENHENAGEQKAEHTGREDDNLSLGVLDEKALEAGGAVPAGTSGSIQDQRHVSSPSNGSDWSRHSNFLQQLTRPLLWMPARCQWDPNDPPRFSMGLNILYAFAACFTVANLYYNQPVLNRIAETFDVSFEKASSVATLLQAGYAAGLLFICPLGDVVKRRSFILGLILVTALMWLGLCITTNFTLFSTLSFLCGATTVTPQLALPLVGDYAPPHRKGSSLSIVVSGLMLGMLVARLFSGIISDAVGSWRPVYWLGLGVQAFIFAALWLFMPDYPPTNPRRSRRRCGNSEERGRGGMGYPAILWSIVYMLFTEPLLMQNCLVAVFISAVFTSFWTTLTFLLAQPPYGYSSLTIGLFSLIGIVAICGGPVYGRLVTDRFVPWFSSLLGQLVTIFGVAVGTGLGTFTVAGAVIEAIAIDIGLQTAQTANRAAIYRINPMARNRVNTAYMVSAFVGQLTGTAVGNKLFAEGGWRWSGGAAIGFMICCIVICFVKGPHEPGWFGWKGGWHLREHHSEKRDEEDMVPKEESGQAKGEPSYASPKTP